MSASCKATCSECGVERFWLSYTLSIQTDDGLLKCLPHPGESHHCEDKHGLTLAQASDRGRLYRETFYVCRTCGKEGETIEPIAASDTEPLTASADKFFKRCWRTGVCALPFFAWMRWWQVVFITASTLAVLHWTEWTGKPSPAKRGLPRPDAPGQVSVPAPTTACLGPKVLGQVLGMMQATGACCLKPDWVVADNVRNEDHVPCTACGRGIMQVSDHMIH